PDGKALLVTASGEMHLRDLATGRPLKGLKATAARGHQAAFSSDGKWLAVAGEDHDVRLLSWPALQEARALPRNAYRVRRLTFSPDSKTLLTIAFRAALHFWDVKTG